MEDLQQLITAKTHLCCNPHHPEPLLLQHCTSAVAAAPSSNSYDPIMVGESFYPRGFTQFTHDYSSSTIYYPTTNTTTVASDHDATAFCSLESAATEKGWFGFDAGNNRWRRQETLSLLEIRSRLDSKFRESNQKGPLWNEISRIMVEEYGYQRSGKKCKEKFENLYKYYKKTKEAKTGKQDGNHYRFFHQLEAIYGETNTTHHASTSQTHHARNSSVPHQTPSSTNNQNSDVFSLSKSSEFETSSSENNEDGLSAIALMIKQSREKQKGVVDKRQDKGRRVRRKSRRAKVEEVVESHMRKIIEAQDAWMKRVLSVVEQREKERVSKEEERKKKESIRFDQEVYDELWAKERAWVEARDAALMEVVKTHIGREFEALPLAEVIVEELQNNKNKSQANDAKEKECPCEAASDDHSRRWTEMEISILIHLRTGFEQRLIPENYGYLVNGVWDDIAAKMVCLGFDRSATECKKLWDEINISLSRTVECGA